jgi:hypothetical protein
VCFAEHEIFQLELQDLARTQAILQHEGDDGEIAEGAKTFPETSYLISREGNDHAARLPQLQMGSDLGMPTAVAERRARGIGALEGRLSWNLLSVMETIQAAQHAKR